MLIVDGLCGSYCWEEKFWIPKKKYAL